MDLRKNKLFSAKNMVLAIIVVGLAAALTYMITADLRSGINKGGYQLVNLSNGERYIGKLTGLSGQYVVLDDVYYQQQSVAGAESGDKPGEIVVAKLSSSVAKPENTMRIARDEIVHWENLQNDSKVVQAIKQDGDSE